MNHRRTFTSWFWALACALLLSCVPALPQSIERSFTDEAIIKSAEQRGRFIAAFEWSVEKSHVYVWPFESIGPAPYETVRMQVEQMPRAWPDKGGARESIPLSASRSLRVNGRWLPRPQRTRTSQEEYLVYLEKGRLRFFFSMPSGFKLDPQNAIVRIRLYQVE